MRIATTIAAVVLAIAVTLPATSDEYPYAADGPARTNFVRQIHDGCVINLMLLKIRSLTIEQQDAYCWCEGRAVADTLEASEIDNFQAGVEKSLAASPACMAWALTR